MEEKEIYKPLGNRVLILPMEITEEDLKIGSIVMTDVLMQKGTVKATGVGEYASQTGVLIPVSVKNGQTVLFRKEAPYLPIRIPNEKREVVEYRLMRDGDIECIIE